MQPLLKLSLSLLLCGYLLSSHTFEARSQNPVCNFTYKKTITLQGSQVVGGPHTDFPILISHTDPDLATAMGKVTSASGYDIIFADDSGNALDFQMEKYDGSTGQYVAWVKIPSLTNGTDVDIHMLYGKSTITTDQSTTAVWGSNYQAVWHLNDDFLDHSANSYDGVNNGSTDVAAKIADGQNFVDPNHWIELPTFPDLTADFSVSGWAFTTDNTQAGQRIFADDANNTGGYALSIGDPGTGRIRFYARGTSPVSLDSPGAPIANSTWHYCVAVTDITNSQKLLYVDGVLTASVSFSGSWGTDNGNASIGGEVASGEAANRFQGNLDEIRVANSALSANWIATEYNSQNQPILAFGSSDPADFYAVGGEEVMFHTSIADGDWDQTTVWDSGEVPDGMFENVVIADNEVDIDAGSADYTICNCTLNGTGVNTFLDISSNRVLSVLGDLDATLSGAGGNDTRLNLGTDAVVNVSGNMTWDRTNTNIADLELLLRNNAVLNLTGNLNFSMGAGDDIIFDLQNNSDANIGGNLNFTQDGGDNLVLDVDNSATVDIAGDIIVDQNGGDDFLIRINNSSGADGVITVTGNLSITHDGGDDIQIHVDDANSLLDISGDITVVCNGTVDSQSFEFNIDDGTLNANDVTLTRDMDMGPVEFDMDGGAVNINSLTVNSGGTLGNNGLFGIDVDGDAVFTNNGDMIANMTGGDDFIIRINDNNGTTGQFINIGNLTLTRSDGDDILFIVDDDNSLFNVRQNLNLTSTGGEQFDIDINNDGLMDIDGNFTVAYSSSQNLEIDLAAGSNPQFNVDGNASITTSGGVSEVLLDLNGGIFSTGMDLSLTNTGAGTTEDIGVEIDGDAALNVGGNMTVDLTGGDDLEIDLGNNTVGSTAQLSVSGNATFTQNRSGADHVIRLLIFDFTRFNVTGNLTWTNSIANTTLTLMHLADTSQASIQGNINLNAQSDGDLEIRLENASLLQIGGNFVRQATPNNFGFLNSQTTATVEYNGFAAQLIAEDAGAGTDNFTYGIVEINNSSGSNPQLTMEGLATVYGGVVFTDGVVATDATDLLVIADGASTAGASDASHIDGFVRKIGNTPAGEFAGNGYAFPVGDDDNYQPVYISAPALTTDQFDAQYLETNPHPTYDNTSLDASLDHISRNEYWLLERTAGSSNVTVRLTWDGNSGGVGSLPDLVVARWDGSTWIDEGNGGTTGTTAAGTVVSAAAITSFSPFTLGTISNLNALPIELIAFKAVANGNLVDLIWSTASEEDNDFFTIERSLDATEWEALTTLPGAGNSDQVLNYLVQDHNPYIGTSYYRLKQTDFDGKFSYSSIERVFIQESPQVRVAPVPASDFLSIIGGTSLDPNRVEVFNSLGQSIHPEIRSRSAWELIMDVSGLPRGMLYLRVTTNLGVTLHKVLVKEPF